MDGLVRKRPTFLPFRGEESNNKTDGSNSFFELNDDDDDTPPPCKRISKRRHTQSSVPAAHAKASRPSLSGIDRSLSCATLLSYSVDSSPMDHRSARSFPSSHVRTNDWAHSLGFRASLDSAYSDELLVDHGPLSLASPAQTPELAKDFCSLAMESPMCFESSSGSSLSTVSSIDSGMLCSSKFGLSLSPSALRFSQRSTMVEEDGDVSDGNTAGELPSSISMPVPPRCQENSNAARRPRLQHSASVGSRPSVRIRLFNNQSQAESPSTDVSTAPCGFGLVCSPPSESASDGLSFLRTASQPTEWNDSAAVNAFPEIQQHGSRVGQRHSMSMGCRSNARMRLFGDATPGRRSPGTKSPQSLATSPLAAPSPDDDRPMTLVGSPHQIQLPTALLRRSSCSPDGSGGSTLDLRSASGASLSDPEYQADTTVCSSSMRDTFVGGDSFTLEKVETSQAGSFLGSATMLDGTDSNSQPVCSVATEVDMPAVQSQAPGVRYKRSVSLPNRSNVRVRLFESNVNSALAAGRLETNSLCNDFLTSSVDEHLLSPALSDGIMFSQISELGDSSGVFKSNCLDAHSLPGLSSLLTAPLLSPLLRSPLGRPRQDVHPVQFSPTSQPTTASSSTPVSKRGRSASFAACASRDDSHTGVEEMMEVVFSENSSELEKADRFLCPCTPVAMKRSASDSTASSRNSAERGCLTTHSGSCQNSNTKQLEKAASVDLPRIFASTSSPQINAAYGLFSPGQSGEQLIGDFSRACSLPICKGSSSGMVRISWSTLGCALKGDSAVAGELVVIDCRYPYEYNGGHIEGAINLSTANEVIEHFLNPNAMLYVEECRASGKAVMPVFHCEFSLKRSVELYTLLRKKDRELHLQNYPKLLYPEMYLLSGGYKEFFTNCKTLCNPPHYVSMNDKKFSGELNRFSRCKSFAGLKADVPRLRHRNSFQL